MERNIVIIGDGYVGKTSILNAIKDKKFQEQIPNVYDDFELCQTVNGKQFQLKFIDTAGQEEFAMIRNLSYKDANLFLLCFAVDDPVSFENMESVWVPDLQNCKDVPVVLVGTKSDLRKTNSCINRDEIIKFQKKINALFYAECSAKTLDGIEDLKKRILKLFAKEKSCIIQ
ncbi:ras-like GTP-binding protein RHO [Tribolium madens]|uniref:ras-like GTP-binding protein RHO n=1 Tax=Tribolium madens TaxID=41895 RepID=UPI001CF727AF|nr:ras-like GTP-binding protein RHO [Tribolium madens]